MEGTERQTTLEDRTDIVPMDETVRILRRYGMRISRETLGLGLQQRVFPFGDAVMTEKSPVYWVYRVLLDQWVRQRFQKDPGDAGGVVTEDAPG